MRKEKEIPQPIPLKELEISASNFDDADLDLTLIDDAGLHREDSVKTSIDVSKPHHEPIAIETKEKTHIENKSLTQTTTKTGLL